MKILVANNCVPFVRGGAEHLAEALTEKLNEFGHQAMLVRIPFRWEPPPKILESMLACRLMRTPNVDRIIAFKFPAYYLPHDNKFLWLVHQFRQVYDLWGTPYQGMEETPENLAVRRTIIEADNTYLREARKIFTNSATTSKRLERFNEIPSEVLYPPLLETKHFRFGETGNYIFCAGRITTSKRQHLLVEAMQHTRTPVQLVIAGKSEDPADAQQIATLIARHKLADRVTVIDRFISEEEKAAYFADALGAAYIPFDEDSYGYVTMEAFYSGKPVITTTDSGGILQVVRDAETGYVAEPTAIGLAGAMDRLYEDPARARSLGRAGYDLIQSMGLTWEHVISTLTAP
jgi:glycosyltransferase involved in cell wall biosynthesis